MRRALLALYLCFSCGGDDLSDVGYSPPGGGGGGDYGPPGGDLGVDTGGAQDIAYARELIESGQVPQEADVTVEGLLSEHDLPPLGPPCEGLFCIRPALAVASSLETGRRETWVHVGMVSGVDAATFRRPPVDLVVLIDKSASMSIDIRETDEAVARLVGNLRPDDRLAILAFDETVHEVHRFGAVTDVAALQTEVRAIPASGGWNIQVATEEAYAILRTQATDPRRMRRVMILSCGYPSVSDADGWAPIVRAGAEDDIGLSFFGVLLGWSPQLGDFLGQTGGGAYYYLTDLARVEQVFDTDFDTMITPVAYDLRFAVELAPGWRMARAYGLPGDAEGAPSSILEVATAFFSNRRGAIVLRLEADAGAAAEAGTITLGYRPNPALGFPDGPDQIEPIRLPEGTSAEATFYASAGAQKAVALVNQAERMRAACAAWHRGDRDAARRIADELLAYLSAAADSLADPALDAEAELVAKLRMNME